MNVEGTVRRIGRMFTAKRVYAEPVERDGITVIPAARVIGGGGAGGGTNPDGNEGGGSGFGVFSRPAGAWVIHNDRAEWRPAASLDRERAVLGSQLLVLLIALAWILGRRR